MQGKTQTASDGGEIRERLAFVDEATAARIRDVSHLRRSRYRDLDVEGTLQYFFKRYVEPLRAVFDLASCTALDCASGYGWLAFSYVLSGGRGAIAMDLDLPRLQAAKAIAAILDVADRIVFAHASLTRLPLEDRAVELALSVETLEHLGGGDSARAGVSELGRVASRGVLITTPNKLFPLVSHDTRLPFVHWLRAGRRRPLTKILGRAGTDYGNEFLTPSDLGPLAGAFRRVSRCLTFPGVGEFCGQYPLYLPYLGTDRHWKPRPPPAQVLYYRAASAILGTRSHWIMPNLAGVYIRDRP